MLASYLSFFVSIYQKTTGEVLRSETFFLLRKKKNCFVKIPCLQQYYVLSLPSPSTELVHQSSYQDGGKTFTYFWVFSISIEQLNMNSIHCWKAAQALLKRQHISYRTCLSLLPFYALAFTNLGYCSFTELLQHIYFFCFIFYLNLLKWQPITYLSDQDCEGTFDHLSFFFCDNYLKAKKAKFLFCSI